MDKLIRRIERPLALRVIARAGLYLPDEHELDRLAQVAADAYSDYPLHEWFCGGEYNPEASERIMRISLHAMIKDAVIYADSEELNGFAVWLPRGFTGLDALAFLFNGGLGLTCRTGPGILFRLLRYENLAMRIKKEQTDNRDWYLYNLSIRRSAQGKGLASKLLRPMLDFCDSERTVAYLETNKQSNVGLYEHYGFELRHEESIPKSPITHYAMVRHPQA